MFLQKVSSSVMFVIAFVTCPCHLPITMPLILILLAGTPAAVWLTQHGGWVYGILTGVFLLSLAMGFGWAGYSKESVGEVCEPSTGRAIQAASVTKEYNK